MNSKRPTRRLSAVMSADIVGYSRLMGADAEGTVRRLEGHRESIERLIEEHDGRLANFVGDNFLTEFSSASAAVDCALDIQGMLATANESLDARSKMLLRIGLHLGEVRVEGERIFGPVINIAARIESTTEPGGVCISEAVQQQLSAAPQFSLDDLGLQEFKNIEGRIRIYRVRRSEELTSVPDSVASSDQVPSIAVLPFVNMSSDPDQEFFGDGMAEEIINALAQVARLRVIARTSAFRFKGTSTDVRSIGQMLGVGFVVEGSVRRSGNRLRIAAQLVDTAAGHHLWSEVFDREADNVFAIQDEIARSVVETVRPKLLPDEQQTEPAQPIVAAPTENQQAYELYLRAGRCLAHLNRWDTRLAVAMLEDAVQLDANYSGAWARLGGACCAMEYAFDPDGDWIVKAEQAVDRALALDPNSAEAEHVRARILWSPRRGFRHTEALSALARSLALQPGGVEARLWNSIILFHLGLFEQAESGLVEVLASDPNNGMALSSLGQYCAFSGRFDDATRYFERSLEEEPGNLYATTFYPISRVYADDLKGAERALEKSRDLLVGEPMLEATEALIWARRGERQRAEDAVERGDLSKRSVGHLHHYDHVSACALALLGDADQAVARLNHAAETGFPNYPLFRSDSHLRNLGNHRPMQDLLVRLKGEWTTYRSFVGS